MKLNKLHFSLLAAGFALCSSAKAQLFIDQAQFTIQAGATVTVQGDVTSNTDILGTGKVVLNGSSNQNVNVGGFTVPNLEVNNAANVTLTGAAKISGDLLFTNGKILLGNNNLTIGSAGTITSASSTKYVVTNGTGKLVKAALSSTAFNFPVGNSTTAYDAVSIANTGTADDIGVRSFANVLTSGASGAAYTKEVVNNSWDVSEAVAGGSNLSLTANWDAADELTGFDRTRGGISNYLTTPAASVGWDLLNSQTGAATGSGPYSYTRSGVTTVGVFAVGTRPVSSPLLVSPKVYLQGPFNTGTGMMGDGLRSANLIPTTEPYSNTTYVASAFITNALRGSGGGETSTSSVVGSAAGASTNNSVVDWVVVQLHRSSDGVVVSQRAALIQRDGDVVDTDGTSPVNLAGNAAGSYYISVRHRNHLGARSAATLTLAKVSTTNYDFTTSNAQAFAGAVSNNALATLVAGTTFGLWGGNSNADLFTRKTGSAATNDYSKLVSAVASAANPGPTGVYRTEDFNMDGNVRKTGSALTNDYSRLLAILGVASIITQPSF
jgi:hypothetical protein